MARWKAARGGIGRSGVAALLAAASFLASPPAQPQRAVPQIVIAIVADGPSEPGRELRLRLLKEIREVNQGDFSIEAPEDLGIEADWTLAGADAALGEALADRRPNLVITLGVLSSYAAMNRADLSRPVVAPFIVDRELQQAPYENGASGRSNLVYVSMDADVYRDLVVFREVVPFTRLAFLLDAATLQAIPGARAEITAITRELSIEASFVEVAADAAAALEAIPAGTEAAYVGPLLRLPSAEFESLVAGLVRLRLPSFASSGHADVERGLMVGLAPELQMDRLIRRVALDVRRILLGEAASALPVAFPREEGLTINMRTARAIGFSPGWRVLTSAELLHDAPESAGRPLSLPEAIEESVERNLDLRVARSTVAAGREDVREARSALLPQLGVGASYVALDPDNAAALPGAAERTTGGTLILDQVLYAEPAWANLGVQRHLQEARESDRDQLRLDIVLETAQAYLDLLRARTDERIQGDNLRLTRSNLELARARRQIGTAGPSEVYRWESVLANAQRAVVEAHTGVGIAEIRLNALLHRPLEEPIAPVEVGLADPVLIASQERLYELIDNPASFRALRDFIVEDAFASVPELRTLDARILAQERRRDSARRAFWQPSLALRASRDETFSRGGARGPVLPGLPDDETTVSLQLSFPLFTGGARSAGSAKATEELAGLRLARASTAERVEQRIRITLLAARSAYTAIRLSRQAADAARLNLDTVREAYSLGTLSILDLLDAQNAALVAELRAATAVYDFVKALMDVERAAGRFDFFLSAQEQDAWFERLEGFLVQRGIERP